MITPEEERRIIETAKEEIMLSLPQVWSSLFVDMKSQMKLNEKFYKEHPEFKGHEDTVKSVIDMIDGKNPAMPLKDKLSSAVPEIRKVMQQKQGLTMDVGGRPDTSFKPITSESMGNGAI